MEPAPLMVPEPLLLELLEFDALVVPEEPAEPEAELLLLEDPQAATSRVAAIARAIAGMERCLKIVSFTRSRAVSAPPLAPVLFTCGHGVIDL